MTEQQRKAIHRNRLGLRRAGTKISPEVDLHVYEDGFIGWQIRDRHRSEAACLNQTTQGDPKNYGLMIRGSSKRE